MSFPVYSIEVERPRVPPYDRSSSRTTGRRDPTTPRRTRACAPMLKLPVFRVVLRKDRTIRVPETMVAGPDQAARVAYALLRDSPFEKMLAILVGARGQVVGAIVIATTSSISSTAVSIRGVFVGAIAHNASGVILAHNHPSGDPTPSREDLDFTGKIAEASRILQIPILDNLIVTADPNVWRSFSC